MADSGLGGIFGQIFGGGMVDTNQTTPQIDTGATNDALKGLNNDPNAAQQQQAAGLMQQIAQGNGPSAAQSLLNQQTATAMGQTNAMGSSGSGQAGQGLARRQAMIQGAGLTQGLGGQAATARAQEQLGGLGELGQQTTAARGQDIQSSLGSAGIQAGLASNQAGLQEQTQEQTLEAQKSNQQAGTDAFKTVMGGIAGLAMVSSPEAKADAQPADGSASKQPTTGEKVGGVFAGLAGGPSGAADYATQVRQKHSGIYKPSAMQQFAQLSSPPAAKTDVKPAYPPAGWREVPMQKDSPDNYKIPAGWHVPDKLSSPPAAKTEVAPADNRPEVRMPMPGEYSFSASKPKTVYKQPSPHGYAAPLPETTASADDNDEEDKPLNLVGRPAYVRPAFEHERPELPGDEPEPSFGDWILTNSPGGPEYFARTSDIPLIQRAGHGAVSAPEPHLPVAQFPARDARTRLEPMHMHEGPSPKIVETAAERKKQLKDIDPKLLSSPPEAKQDAQPAAVEDALRGLHPYSYRYKDPSNEPIPNPTGMERFFGIMTTDLKKHPVTRNMVSGQGADEKIAIPAATSFTLASAAHLQQKNDELSQRVTALEKMLSGKGRR